MQRWLRGAAAGLLGGLAMKAFVALMDRHAFGLSAETDANSAHDVWRQMGWGQLKEKQAERIGAAMHYAFSVGAGALYAELSLRYPKLRAGGGAAFGAVMWLVGDEIAVTAAGFEDPLLASKFSHASALAAHVIYGMVVEAASGEPAPMAVN